MVAQDCANNDRQEQTEILERFKQGRKRAFGDKTSLDRQRQTYARGIMISCEA